MRKERHAALHERGEAGAGCVDFSRENISMPGYMLKQGCKQWYNFN
jgi:hypothetical protein